MTDSGHRFGYPSHMARLTNQNRGYFVFLINQSYSMSNMFGNESSGMTLVRAAARTINVWIEEMCIEAAKGDKMKDWFDVSVIGYSTDDEGEPIVRTMFAEGALAGKERVTVPELADNIAFEEVVEQKFFDPSTGELVAESTERPGWVRPMVQGATPLNAALYEAHRLVKEWIEQGDHKEQSLPPIVINITDAELNDEGGEYTPEQYAQRLKDLQTDDGNVLLFNWVLSPRESTAVLFPHSVEQLQGGIGLMRLYETSSQLPARFRAKWNVLRWNTHLVADQPKTRCFACNISDTSIGMLVSLFVDHQNPVVGHLRPNWV
jgi:hypothetical protein